LEKSLIDQLEFGGGETGGGDAVTARFAKRIGCDVNYLRSILSVESGGQPYDKMGRLIILTEKHVFWRELPKALRAKAQRAGLATPKWSRSNYKDLGGTGSDKRWRKLRAMVGINETAGYRSASYGAPQIMGFNHKVCGYSTVQAMVKAFGEAETYQVEGFITYLENNGMGEDLRQRDTRAITRRYNGSGQVDLYSRRIDDDYRKRTGEAVSVVNSKRSTMLRMGSTGDGVGILQNKLIALGYHVTPDSDFGPATRKAIASFQVDHGLAPDGMVGQQTRNALERAVPLNQQPGNSRDQLTVKDLRERGSQTVKQGDRLTYSGIIAMVFGSTAELAEIETKSGMLGFASEAADRIKQTAEPLLSLASGNAGLAIVVFGGLALLIAHKIKTRRLEDAKEWRHVG